MGFFSRLFGRKEEQPTRTSKVAEAACPHTAVIPRWDSADDIGKLDRVTSYLCEGCGVTFSREEGERLHGEAAERLRLADAERLKHQ